MKTNEIINEYKKINPCSLKEFIETTLKNGTPEQSKIEFQLFNAVYAGADVQSYFKGEYHTPSTNSTTGEYLVISFGTKGSFDITIDRTIPSEDAVKTICEAFEDVARKKFNNAPARWLLNITHVALGINGNYDAE